MLLSLIYHIAEDAPALDAIHSFKATVKDGKVLVSANEQNTLKNNKARPPKLSVSGETAPGKGVVIVGGGAGAIHTVEGLREVCIYATSVTCINLCRYSRDSLGL